MPAPFARTAQITQQRAAAGAAPGADNLFDLAIASEAPYERWWGVEILGCTPEECDLSRLGDGRHPLLLNHETDDQIGVVARAWIEAGLVRGKCKFSRAALGQEIRQDVEDGIRSLVSVGYFIDELVELAPPEESGAEDYSAWVPTRTLAYAEFEREMRQQHGEHWNRAGVAAARGNGDRPAVYRVTKWTPFEASVVAVPADVEVGFDRMAGSPVPPQTPATPAALTPTPLVIVEKTMTENVTKSPAELDAERKLAIISLGTQYAKYLGPNDVVEACTKGMSVEAFKDFIIGKLETRHTDTSQIHVGLTPKEVRRYSLGRALRAMTLNDWTDAGFERECSEAVAKIMGRSPEGMFVPPEVFHRDFNVGTASEAGNLKPTEFRGDMFVDALRNNLVMGQLGVRVLAGLTADVDLPRKSGVSTIGTTSEVGSASETNPTTAKVTLQPKRATAYVEVSKQAIIQSAMALEGMIRDDLVMGAAVHIENQCINGTATAPQMTGIRYTTGIGTATAGANGGTVSWANIVALETAVANSNAEPDRLAGYLINTKTRGAAKQVQKGTNLPFIWDGGPQPLNGYRAAVSNNVPSNLTKGTSTTVCSAGIFASDWSMGVIGLFGAPDVTVDPYTKADTGQVKITLNQFADFGIRQPAAFAKIEDLLT